MNVVYDEQRATNEATQFSQKERRNRRIGLFLLALACLGAIASVVCLIFKNEEPIWLLGQVVMIPAMAASFICLEPSSPPPNLAYYVAAQGKTVLDINVQMRSNGWMEKPTVCVVTEDENGNVTTTELFLAEYQESTKFDEKTVDLNECIVYTPYAKE